MTVRKKEFGKPRYFYHPESDCVMDTRDWREYRELGSSIELVEFDEQKVFDFRFKQDAPIIQVVNMHYQTFDLKVDRSSPWGNTFRTSDCGSRAAMFQRYEAWITSQPKLINDLMAKIRKVWIDKGYIVVRIGCWCKPRTCHGDIIKNVLDRRIEKIRRGDAH